MDRQSRSRGRPPLSHGHDISNDAQAVQTQSHGVLTKQRKRSLSRTRIVQWANRSAANLSNDLTGASASTDRVGRVPDEPSNRMSFSQRITNAKDRFRGNRSETNTSGLSANSSGSNVNGKAGADSPSAGDDDCESVILDTTNEPLQNGSAKQMADPAAPSPSLSAQQQQQQGPPIPPKVKPNFLLLEPPPPIASYSADGRQVQQPMGRSVPMKPASENTDSNPRQRAGKVDILEPPPPVRSAIDPRQARNTAPQPQKQQKQLPSTPSTSGLSLGTATKVVMKFKGLRRASSKRSADRASTDRTVNSPSHSRALSNTAGPNVVPPPPVSVGSGPLRVTSLPKNQLQQQTVVQNPTDSSPASTSSGNANVPPPPPPIHAHPAQMAAWEEQQQQQYQQYSQPLKQSRNQSQDPRQYNYSNAIQDPYQYAARVEAELQAELDAVRQQCIAQVDLLNQRNAQIGSLSNTVERLRERMQDQLQQQFELETVQRGGLYAAASASLPDSQVRSRWVGLRWQIQQCVEAAVRSHSQKSLSVVDNAGAQLRRLSPDYAALLQSSAGTVCLVEAAVWTVLAQHVFGDARRSSPMCWASPPWDSLIKVNDSVLCTRPTDAAFHQWRAQTAVFVLSQAQKNKEKEHEVVRQLDAEVGGLLAMNPTDTGLHRQLTEIVSAAVSLDADLCQQRAWFYVHFPQSGSGKRYGMPLDAGEMAVVEQEEVMASEISDTVSLVVRPALFKAGNSRGEAYDEVEPIEPSVVCRQSSPQPRR